MFGTKWQKGVVRLAGLLLAIGVTGTCLFIGSFFI